MTGRDELREAVEGGMRLQAVMLKGLAVTCILMAVVLAVLAVVVPAKPGDENGKIACIVIGLAMGVGGAVLWTSTTRRIARTRRLVFEAPREIASMQVVRIQRRGMVIHAVHLKDGAGKLVGIPVGSEAAANDLVRRLRERQAASV